MLGYRLASFRVAGALFLTEPRRIGRGADPSGRRLWEEYTLKQYNLTVLAFYRGRSGLCFIQIRGDYP